MNPLKIGTCVGTPEDLPTMEYLKENHTFTDKTVEKFSDEYYHFFHSEFLK